MRLTGRTGLFHAPFFAEFFYLAVPIILTNLMGSSLHIIDNIMVGRLGETELAAVAQANQLAFLTRLFLFGVACGCSIFASQYWGNRDVTGVRRTLGVSLLFALPLCALATGLALLAPTAVMRVFSPDPAVIALGASYLRTVGPGYVAIALSNVLGAANRSTERVRLNMAASMSAIACNTFLNWCFIFGNLGFPRMGVPGAALATAIAAYLEAGILLVWAYARRYPSAATFHQMKPPSAAFVRRFLKVAVPVTLNEGVWALGVSAMAAVYGRMSTQTVAAMNVFGTVEQLCMAALWGTMNAAAVIVGKRVGADEGEDAYLCGQRMLIIGVAIATVMGVALLLLRHQIVSVFNISPEAKALAVGVMGLVVYCYWAKAFNAVNIVGILRAGGDAVFSMLLDILGMWLIGVPLAAMGGLYFHLALPAVYLMLQLDEVTKFFIGLFRFRSKKWIRNLVKGDAHA